jgi:putative methionine-R-sulfoxide reductase with GAF domain
MSPDSSLDPESFQRLLSNAFAVQESGMDAQSLTAIVELQRAVATGEADVDRALDLIAVHARNVANATGIAIGLLKGDQLVYRAGSGSGVTYVGQHVMATLCVAGHNVPSGEILRVENAQTDRRIEAAICRQFGADSLLILPIYYDGTMAGVLDVLFDEAHAFQHREMLTYRLMAALVGEAMSYAARPEQKEPLAADLSTMRQCIRLTRPQKEETLNDVASVPGAATNRAIYQAFETFIARAGRLPALTHSAWSVLKRAKCVLWNKGRWETAVGIAAMLAIACWIGFRDRRPASSLGVSGLQESSAPRQQMPFAPAKRVLANSTSRQTALGLEPRERKSSRSMPQRVLDRSIRVRYISDDVTVRYFTPNPPPQLALDRNIRVRYISDDVTVRYFTPNPPVAPPPVSR